MIFETADEIKKLNLYDIIKKRSIIYPNRTALQLEKVNLTFSQLVEKINIIAMNLQKDGFKTNDKLAILLPNTIENVLFIYAVNKLGGCFVLLNPLENFMTINSQIKASKAKYLVFSEISNKKVFEISQLGGLDKIRLIYTPLSIYFSAIVNNIINYKFKSYKYLNLIKEKFEIIKFNEFLNQDSSFDPKINNIDPLNDDAAIVFSSGSSGTPKAIVHTSYSINFSTYNCLSIEKELDDGLSLIGALPFFHIFGLVVTLHISLSSGGKLILVPIFNSKKVAKLFLNEKIAYFPAVATMYIKILKTNILQKALKRQKLNLKYFRRGFVGGDILPNKTKTTFNDLIKKSRGEGFIVEGYGLTECCPVSVNLNDNYPSGCIGTVFDGIKIKIDKNYNENDEYGEICILSNSLFKNYLSEGFVKEGSAKNKWFKTGDYGKYENGKLFFNCRNNQIIKVSGHCVNLKKIEIILDRSDFIYKSIAIGVNDEIKINVVKVFIVIDKKFKNNKLQINLKKINEIYDKFLNPWERPKYTVICKIEDIPKTPLGKTAYHLIK